MTERKTDLAMEVRESFPRDNVEIKGVVLEKKRDEKSGAKITVVEIKDEKGSKAMKKPQGTYITIESEELLHDDEDNENLLLCICKELERMVKGLRKKTSFDRRSWKSSCDERFPWTAHGRGGFCYPAL